MILELKVDEYLSVSEERQRSGSFGRHTGPFVFVYLHFEIFPDIKCVEQKLMGCGAVWLF